jgi:hypothetical protein
VAAGVFGEIPLKVFVTGKIVCLEYHQVEYGDVSPTTKRF